MSDYLSDQKPDFNRIVEFFKKDLSSLRIGRATPSLVEEIMVEAYGTLTPLNQLASISITDPKTLTIQPWDKNSLKAIEVALQKADLGCSPIINDNTIIISLPPLTEETRISVIKKMRQKMEEAKISIRGQREKVKEDIINEEKDKIISEDDKFKRLEDLDEIVKMYNEQLKSLTEKKEEEIMKI